MDFINGGRLTDGGRRAHSARSPTSVTLPITSRSVQLELVCFRSGVPAREYREEMYVLSNFSSYNQSKFVGLFDGTFEDDVLYAEVGLIPALIFESAPINTFYAN